MTAAIAEIDKDKAKKRKHGNNERVDVTTTPRKSPKNSDASIKKSRSDSASSITEIFKDVNIEKQQIHLKHLLMSMKY